MSLREELRELSKDRLYFLAKVILGYSRLTAKLHEPLCAELDQLSLPFGRRIDLWPRGHYKTSCITISKAIQHYLRDNEVRVLIANASALNATKWLQNIQAHFEQNTVFRWVWEDKIPDIRRVVWNQHQALCPRQRHRAESTFETIGVGGRVTGRHYDVIIKDDLIDDKTIQSPEVMQNVIDWHEYAMNLFDGPAVGVDHMVGTRWSMGDVYGYTMETSREYVVRRISALNANNRFLTNLGFEEGEPILPVAFPKDALLEMRRRDPYKFACQQMNDPKDPSIADFRLDYLRYYKFDPSGNLLIEVEG